MHANVVSMTLFKARHTKHVFDNMIYEQLKGRCPISRIERAQIMCAANIRNNTPEDEAIRVAVKWAALPSPTFDMQARA